MYRIGGCRFKFKLRREVYLKPDSVFMIGDTSRYIEIKIPWGKQATKSV